MNHWEKQLQERDRQIAELLRTVWQLTEGNRRLQKRVEELKAVLGKRQQANDSQPPQFSGNYSLTQQELKQSRNRWEKSPGRTPNEDKLNQVQDTRDVYPKGLTRNTMSSAATALPGDWSTVR